MALLYQDMHEGTRLFVITHLVTQQGTITAQYDPSAARIEYTRPALRQYIQQRNKWSDTTMASINWNSHGQTLQNHLYLRLHFSKLVHDILPTTAHLHKMDRGKRERLCCSHRKKTKNISYGVPIPPGTNGVMNSLLQQFTTPVLPGSHLLAFESFWKIPCALGCILTIPRRQYFKFKHLSILKK